MFPMNVIIWNIRGVGNSTFFACVKKLVVDHSPLVLAIIEPFIYNLIFCIIAAAWVMMMLLAILMVKYGCFGRVMLS